MALPPMSRGMQLFAILVFAVFGVFIGFFLGVNPLGLSILPGAVSEAPAAPGPSPTLYQCPMHPEVLEPEPGVCPICKMDLVPIEGPAEHAGHSEQAGPDVVYQCPMHPEVLEPEPGSCPICKMDLVAVEPAAGSVQREAASGGSIVEIDPAQVQNIGVVTAPAEESDIAQTSETVGFVDYNTENITWVTTKFAGWIEKVRINYVGQEVERGEPLFDIYSPELVSTQEEYLRALDYRSSLASTTRPEVIEQADSLLRATRERLAYWDIDNEQIEELERTRTVQRRLVVNSPSSGVITHLMQGALEGLDVKPGMELYKIADLSTVWVHADVFERDLRWLREGQKATISFPNDAATRHVGKVLFLYPEVSRDTRTLRACLEVRNPQTRLRPGMYADVVIQGPPIRGATVVPGSAVIRSGARNLVFVALGEGRFEPREVTLGIKASDEHLQILDGISPGERVVVQAQFLLDSESRLQEAIAKFMAHGRSASPKPAAQHHAH
ncbi:MAG: efflux RND transporter periplasmic adaptor subunit [Acidobacteriota bacterium]|nr:MAG: efflux RND transporter periplasmic adaptor subunit [Acidobacteriota bacterium]